MPPVSIKYVVSFSSQDEKHPVTNIVKGDGFKKWLSHPLEKSGQIEAVFQLEHPCIISYIDIGSIWCATLEIKVGCSEWPVGREFETLAYTVSLMSPADCLTNRNPNKTQMFSSDLFCSDTAKKEWDRIKVVCRQPYKKLTQFGLSFLRVKSLSSLPERVVEKKEPSDVTSVKDIKNHFLGMLDNISNKSSDQLKTRLLKIAATAELGIEHNNTDALSRTAKLVLAASGNKSKSYNALSAVPDSEKNRLYSSRVEQNFSPEFVDEVAEFLQRLILDPKDLDSITLADVRHKFERKKKRKLTKDEKRVFIEKATNYLSTAFKDKTNVKSEKENVGNKDNDDTTVSVISNKKVQHLSNGRPTNSTEFFGKNEVDNKISRPNVKRKLENDCTTPPPSKIMNNNKSPVSVIQKMKSVDNQTVCTAKCDTIDQLRRVKQNGPIKSCVTSPAGTPYQYKGLRGREPDFDKEESPVSRTKTPLCAKQISSSPATENKKVDDSFVISSSDDSLTSDLDDSDLDMLVADSKKTIGQTSVRGKGRGCGRGRGRGRKSNTGSATKKSATPSGRGKKCRNGSFQSSIDNEDVAMETSLDVMTTPRGFSKCSGCGDYFGETLLNAHQQKCAALKSTRILDCDTSRGSVAKSSGANSASKRRKKRPSVSSLEVRPTGFVKCDGCNEYFGDNLCLHQQNCLPWKNPSKSDVSAYDESSWCSAKPLDNSKIKSTNHNTPNSNTGQSLQKSNVKSPPWLLAAEKRLQQQKNGGKTNSSFMSHTGALNSSTCSVSSSSPSSSSIASQQRMFEKYEQQLNHKISENSQSQSILHRKNSSHQKSRRINGGISKNRRNSGISQSRFSSFDISDDSDDDIDDDISVNVGASANDDRTVEEMVQCPLCNDSYPACVIEEHAATCYL